MRLSGRTQSLGRQVAVREDSSKRPSPPFQLLLREFLQIFTSSFFFLLFYYLFPGIHCAKQLPEQGLGHRKYNNSLGDLFFLVPDVHSSFLVHNQRHRARSIPVPRPSSHPAPGGSSPFVEESIE